LIVPFEEVVVIAPYMVGRDASARKVYAEYGGGRVRQQGVLDLLGYLHVPLYLCLFKLHLLHLAPCHLSGLHLCGKAGRLGQLTRKA